MGDASVSPAAATRWWLVRHAPIAVPNAGRINGQRDVDSDVGDEAAFAALALALPQDAFWVTSTLKRTQQTAAALGRNGLPAEAAFAEQHFGDWQGMTWDEVAALPGGAADAFWRDPGRASAPGGESFAQQVARVAGAMTRLSSERAGADIVAVVHAGVIRAALAHALDMEPARALSVVVDTLSVTRIDHFAAPPRRRGGSWRVGFVNRTFGG